MKKKRFVMIGAAAILLASCQSEIGDIPIQEEYTPETYTGVERDVMVNIMSSHFGGYRKGKPATRSMGGFTLTPYVENGDTLMYVAQYDNGWELYSANTATQMLLFSSDEGTFDMDDVNMPDAMRDVIREKLEEIRDTPKEGMPINRSWGGIGVTEEELAKCPVICHKKNKTATRAGEEYPDGDWILIESEELSRDIETSSKLIKTKWGQNYPWNQFTKIVSDGTNTAQGLVGCVPVAIGQYLYYTHYKDGFPKWTVTTATPIYNGVDFSFSGSSSTVWDNMARYYWNTGTTEAAIFLGYVGRELDATYEYGETKVGLSKTLSYLNKTYSGLFSQNSYGSDYIVSSLKKSYPVLISASSYQDKTDNDKGIVGHLFLIDQYRITTVKTKYVYGLENAKWDGDGDDPYDEELDEEGNVIGHAYTKELISTSVTIDFSMNWGWNGSIYDSKWYGSYYSWETGSYSFDLDRIMLKRSDVK